MAHSLFSSTPLNSLHFSSSSSSSSSSASKPRHPRLTLPYRIVGISSAIYLQRALAAKASQMPGPMNTDDEPDQQQDNKPVISNSPIPFLPNFNLASIPVWIRWLLAPIILVALPYYKKFSMIEDKAEKVAQSVLEGIERAAETTEKITEEIAEQLPEGRLKEMLLEGEAIAKVVDKGAEAAEDLFKKVDDVVERVDDVVEGIEEMVELPIGKGSKKEA